MRLYGSALDALVDAVEVAHIHRGHAGVSAALRPGAVARSGTGRRSLVVELRRAGVPVAPLALLPVLLYPIVWLVGMPLRMVGISVRAGLDVIGSIVRLPARIIGGRPVR